MKARTMIERLERVKVSSGLIAVVISITALGLGYAASAAILPTPKIGVIHIDVVIDRSIQPYFTIPLNYAAQNRDVAAVVLLINSPGGGAATSEELFYRVVELRSQKPVVASIDSLAASGAYYTAIGSNYIYAKPAALVGSIGVRADLPQPVPPDETTVLSGPFKGSGNSQIDWIRGMDVIKETFVTNVHDQRLYILENMHDQSRAERLPDKDQLATGQVWIAPVAYDIGLIDALGSNLDAIQKAAELAQVTNYEVIDLTFLTLFGDPTYIGSALPPDLSTVSFAHWSGDRPNADYLESGPWPTFEHLYLPPTE